MPRDAEGFGSGYSNAGEDGNPRRRAKRIWGRRRSSPPSETAPSHSRGVVSVVVRGWFWTGWAD